MVLFYDDWEEFGAFPDWSTKNQSFIDICGVYKAMGIKNYMWPLALYDEKLIGVDPFDPDISPEMVIRVTEECKINFMYFIREVARDPQGSDEFPIRFNANRGVMALYWCYFNHILIVLIMIRQTGKSFGIDWLNTWINNIGAESNETAALLKDEKLRTRSVERLKGMELTLPKYLKQRSSKDPGNTEVMRISALDNTFKAYVPNRSPKMADLIGRGMTSHNIECDEFAYTACNWITIPVMLSSSLAARDVAKIKNAPYGVIFATTSGKRDTPEGKYAYNFMSACAIFSDKWFDLSGPEELYEVIKKAGNGHDIRVNATFNHRQLGKTDEWLRDRLRDSAQEDPIQIQADFLNEWPSGTTHTPFKQEVAKAMRDSEVLDFDTEFVLPESYSLRWYYGERERQQKMLVPHILANDPSEGVGRDGIGFVLTNAYTGEVAMAADISEANIMAYYRFVGNFLLENPTVTLIVERKSTGAGLCDYLMEFLLSKGINPFTRLFNQVVQLSDENPDRFNEIKDVLRSRDNLCLKYKRFFGWATSATGATARSELFSRTLNKAASLGGSLMRDRKLILQTLGLEIRNGRVDHAEGEHDDLTFSWLLSYWMLSLGKNLQYYGIDSSKIFSQNPSYLSSLKEVSKYDRYVNHQARMEVELLTEQLKVSDDEYLSRKLEYDLEMAVARLSEQDRQSIVVDDLINKLREDRNGRRRNNPLAAYYNQNMGYR